MSEAVERVTENTAVLEKQEETKVAPKQAKNNAFSFGTKAE